MPAHIPGVPYRFPGQLESQTLNLYDRLLQDRLIFLNQAIDSAVANQTIAALLYLDAEDTDRDIRLYINSQGDAGRESFTAGLAIYDTMQCLRNDVMTVCTGFTTGVATFLLAMGTPGKRFALPNARLMLSQLRHVLSERAVTEIDIEARELLQLRQMLAEILAQRTGQAVATVLEDTERDFYLSPQAALDYGLIDHIASRA
ncbi:MAG: ATP-dependent Clp protease proteolytic subunit [Leptolyngbya sp. SIO1D8]|nr:ATP-dependent Clp protease proteolytic subunit [Leptolyngbya sp. SIO1D8]